MKFRNSLVTLIEQVDLKDEFRVSTNEGSLRASATRVNYRPGPEGHKNLEV